MGLITRFNLNDQIAKFDADFFIETGTGKGAGVAYAATFPFKKIFSVEINKELFDEVFEKFSEDNRIILSWNESADFLDVLLEFADPQGNAIFFLDSHFPGADYCGCKYDDEKNADINIPLKKELEIISKRNGKYQDIIIIDDLRLFIDDKRIQYWDVNSFWKQHGSNVTKEQLVTFDLIEVVNNLFPNHDLEYDFRDEGYLILTPKK